MERLRCAGRQEELCSHALVPWRGRELPNPNIYMNMSINNFVIIQYREKDCFNNPFLTIKWETGPVPSKKKQKKHVASLICGFEKKLVINPDTYIFIMATFSINVPFKVQI